MKYVGMLFGMWVLFAGSFQKQLTAVLGYDADTARAITKKAKPQYRQIIRRLPEFEKGDRFKMNLVNCAMIGAFILSMPEHPDVERLTEYYAKSMMTKPMQWFCRKSGKSKFTPKDIAAMKATAALKAADRNPYSWNMEFYELSSSRRSEKSSFSYHSAFFSAVIAVASSISPGWVGSLKMSVIKFRLFSSVLPAACAVRDAPQANAATAEAERKFLRVIFMVVCLLYIWIYFTQTVGGCRLFRMAEMVDRRTGTVRCFCVG